MDEPEIDDPLVTVETYSVAHEAWIARNLLESLEIEAFVVDSQVITMNWMLSNALGGVKVQVRSSQLDAAKDALRTRPHIPPDDEGWGACVSCGSKQIELTIDKRRSFLTWLFLGLPILLPKRRFACRACGLVMQKTA